MGRKSVIAIAAVVCALLAAPASASAESMVLQGRFVCNDGQPLAGVRVELRQTFVRWLPEVPPNVRLAVATHADANGGWRFRTGKSETNWRVRAVLVGGGVGVKDFPLPWHHYADTLRTQNNRPLADYGNQVLSGAECRLWRAFKSAADGYRADTGRSNPAGQVTVTESAPTAGVPFVPYTDVFWPGGYSPTKNIGTEERPMIRSVAQHEFAHTVRHSLDGDPLHFGVDSARYWYLRKHSATSCESTNHGFAFNEGWAEYWADQVTAKPCPNAKDFGVERNVAFELKRLQESCRVNRARMVQVLAQNRGSIHSMANFSNALGCQPPRPIKRLGKSPRPKAKLASLARARLTAGRAWLRTSNRLIAQARVNLSKASGSWPRTLLRGRLQQAQALRETFAYLGNRASQRRIVRESDSAQLRLIKAKQRAYMRRVKSISIRTLRLGAHRFQKRGNRQAATLLRRASSMVARGNLEALQALAQPPNGGSTSQSGYRFTDWTSVSGGVASGSLGGSSISLSGSDVNSPPASTLDGSSTVFNRPEFTPPLPASDAIHFLGSPGGTYTLQFGARVTNPVLNLGSLASTLQFPAGTQITRLSGDSQFRVSGSTVSGEFEPPTDDANGSVRLSGTFTSITFSATFSGTDGIYLQAGA